MLWWLLYSNLDLIFSRASICWLAFSFWWWPSLFFWWSIFTCILVTLSINITRELCKFWVIAGNSLVYWTSQILICGWCLQWWFSFVRTFVKILQFDWSAVPGALVSLFPAGLGVRAEGISLYWMMNLFLNRERWRHACWDSGTSLPMAGSLAWPGLGGACESLLRWYRISGSISSFSSYFWAK